MNHTEEFNKIMQRSAPPKKVKAQPVRVKLIGARDNMDPMQADLAKCEICGNQVSLPFEKLGNYDQVRKALLNAGATYSRSKFIFPNDAAPYIERLMGGEKVNIKKEFQFYATPPELANYLVSIAIANGLNRDSSVLEPSAGQGAIIKAIQERVKTTCRIYYCELMDINRNVLSQTYNTFLLCDNFMDIPAATPFDVIIANPPFNKNQDIDHIRKMYEVCKPGGVIVTIASNSWRQGSQKKQEAFRSWIEEIGAEVEDVQAGAFKESGTNIQSCIITIKK